MDDLTTERSFILQGTFALDVIDMCFVMLFIDVYTARHCQTYVRRMQEFEVCTVVYLWMCVHSGTGRSPVNWCRHQMSALYLLELDPLKFTQIVLIFILAFKRLTSV